MNKYFLHINYQLAAKNKLQKAALQFALPLDNSLISQEVFDELEKSLGEKVQKLNAQHTKCTPLRFAAWDSDMHARSFALGEGLRITTIKIQREYTHII